MMPFVEYCNNTLLIGYDKGVEAMFGILWAIVGVLVVLWLLGFIFHVAGGLVHILLIAAVVVLIYNLILRARLLRKL
jgi:hypothetical protein